MGQVTITLEEHEFLIAARRYFATEGDPGTSKREVRRKFSAMVKADRKARDDAAQSKQAA